MDASLVVEPSQALVATPQIGGRVLKWEGRGQILCAGSYGEASFVVTDGSHIMDCWECEPYVTFIDESGHPLDCTFELPATRHFLGAEAYFEEGIFICANFAYEKDNRCVVNIFVFSVCCHWGCVLRSTTSCDASGFSGSGLTGQLNSLNAGFHAVAFADFANRTDFWVMTATVRGTDEATKQVLKHQQMLPPGFKELHEVFFVSGSRIYGAKVRRVGVSLPLITLAIAVTAGTTYDVLFEKVVTVPSELLRDRGTDTFRASVVRVRCLSQPGGVLARVCLVRVEVPGMDARQERVLLYLVNLHTQEVVDMCQRAGCFGVEFIAEDGTHIVQVQISSQELLVNSCW
jgi:hypothetical protein